MDLAKSSHAREVTLAAASELFYQEGVRAVGMDLIVSRSGVAKTTIYRHFPTKDALVEAFLEHEDKDFWGQWETVVAPHNGSPRSALKALCAWVGERTTRDSYRGCPQINVAAEFADFKHPARVISRRHKAEMVKRLTALCEEIDCQRSDMCGQQIGLVFDGAFVSDGRLRAFDVTTLLNDAVERLVGSRRGSCRQS